MKIIKHNSPAVTLPDPCNLGVILRTLVIANSAMLLAALLLSPNLPALGEQASLLAAAFQPPLIAILLMLCALRRPLLRMRYNTAVLFIHLLVLSITLLYHQLTTQMTDLAAGHWWRPAFFSLALTAVTLGYFNLRSRALSPAIAEARLQALQARIRPHFLFNSLNAVLSLIRHEPRRAETALENLSELIRALMQDTRTLAPLEREIELCQAYLAIEQLRLGERLQAEWHTDKAPYDALIPPLVLQPLVENAVYHGIEPNPEGGLVSVNIYRSKDEMHCIIKNPFYPHDTHQGGNRLAMDNIKERLALHFDAEASLKTQLQQGHYTVHIVWPYITSGHPTVMRPPQ